MYTIIGKDLAQWMIYTRTSQKLKMAGAYAYKKSQGDGFK